MNFEFQMAAIVLCFHLLDFEERDAVNLGKRNIGPKAYSYRFT